MFEKDACLQQDTSPHSPHTIIPSLIAANSVVLDVGCNTGFLAQRLKLKFCITDGIDINTKALKMAKKHNRYTYKRDLYAGILDIPAQLYDYVVYADILEHLPRPDLILKDTHQYLHKTGHLVISLPNIARIELRILHMIGSFEYAPGIMSPDHLRFFTRSSASKMIKTSGYSIKQIIPTGLAHRFPFRFLDTLTAFQFIFICQKK